jgi:DNA-binding MarR family transcriptional regulator
VPLNDKPAPPSADTPPERHDLNILRSIRRIIQASDVHSKELELHYNITAPQLITLQAVAQRKTTSAHELSKIVLLDASTLVGVIDRLEKKGYVRRERSDKDRRQVGIHITDAGQKFADEAPSPLQSSLAKALTRLVPSEQLVIARSLERIVRMIDSAEDDGKLAGAQGDPQNDSAPRDAEQGTADHP